MYKITNEKLTYDSGFIEMYYLTTLHESSIEKFHKLEKEMISMIKFVMINTKIQRFNLETYTNKLMINIKDQLGATNLEFYFNKDRIRKCSLSFYNQHYLVQFTLVRTPYSYQLMVDLRMDISKKFDKNLHELKIKLKDCMIEDWERCVWLEDKQSEGYAEDLYKYVHSLENKLRRIINLVMFYQVGIDWWDTFAPFKLASKYNQRKDEYKRRAPSFDKTYTNLLSIDTEDLMKILEYKTYIFKEKNIFNQDIESFSFMNKDDEECFKTEWDEIRLLLSDLLNEKNSTEIQEKKLIKIIKNQMTEEINFWEKYFDKWFSCNFEEFKGKWNSFSKDRNHVAHNKLIDDKLYQKFKSNIVDLLRIVDSAYDEFLKYLDEQTIDASAQAEELERERILRGLLRETARINTLEHKEIINLLGKNIKDMLDEIEEQIYYRKDITIINRNITTEIYQSPFEIVSDITDDLISIDLELNIDEREGYISSINTIINYNKEYQDSFYIKFKNTSMDPYLKEDNSVYISDLEYDLDISSLIRIKNLIMHLVNEKIPEIPMESIASFACKECNRNSVSLSNEVVKKGFCLKCGNINEVGVCLRCETGLDKSEDSLCEACKEYIETM